MCSRALRDHGRKPEFVEDELECISFAAIEKITLRRDSRECCFIGSSTFRAKAIWLIRFMNGLNNGKLGRDGIGASVNVKGLGAVELNIFFEPSPNPPTTVKRIGRGGLNCSFSSNWRRYLLSDMSGEHNETRRAARNVSNHMELK